MQTFSELLNEYENKKNLELTKTGIFYAFSNAQWEENKTHKDAPDSEYISAGYGGYIHKSNKEKYTNFFNKILPQLKKEFTSKININDLINYELINHECWYTGDWFEIVPLIASYYPELAENEIAEKVHAVYKAHPERFDW